jgi:PilZ domain
VSAARAMEPAPERRRERRVPVHLPMLVRGTNRSGEKFEEHTSSLNLCRGGAAFSTHFAIDLGERLDIFISAATPAKAPDSEFSTQGRVVHLDRAIDSQRLIVGVEFTGPRFHRIFISEATS